MWRLVMKTPVSFFGILVVAVLLSAPAAQSQTAAPSPDSRVDPLRNNTGPVLGTSPDPLKGNVAPGSGTGPDPLRSNIVPGTDRGRTVGPNRGNDAGPVRRSRPRAPRRVHR